MCDSVIGVIVCTNLDPLDKYDMLPTIRSKVQGQALERFVAGDEVVAHRIDHQAQKLVTLARKRVK